jgi:Uncharacterized conserved protein
MFKMSLSGDPKMIQMSVTGITLDPRTAQPIVILNDDSNVRGLPIWIGRSEARAISFAMGEAKSERPQTHTLFANMIELLGYKVLQIEIDTLDKSTYKATIRLIGKSKRHVERTIDARPSDAIAIALLTNAPILASDQLNFVMDTEAQLDSSFKTFLQDLKASDFNLYKRSPGPTEGENSADAES